MIPKMKLVTGPALYPISLSEVKNFLRVDGTSEDTLIESIIQASTRRLEAETDCKFVTQTWDIFFDSFPCTYKNDWWDGTREGAISELMVGQKEISLPFGPLQSVTHLKTYDEADTAFTFASTNYSIDTVSTKPKLALKIGSVWPQTILRPVNGIEIRGVFGFGVGYTDNSNQGGVPKDIIEAVKQMTAIMYEHRGDEMAKIPTTVSMLIEPYRRLKV